MSDREANHPVVRTCGTMPVHERLLRTDPLYAAARSASETNAWEFANMARASQRSGVTVIPVVVHVVWNTAVQNISAAQIQSQIDVLNRDFRKLNPDVASAPAPFAPLCGDARIEFELAKLDPAGNPTDGINRKKTTKTSFSDDDAVKAAASGGADAWPAANYLNLWVCPLGNNLLGYAQFPGGAAATDGVVILHSAFGNTGTAAAPFGLGRTATHEIGHWLNLRHIWGDDGNGCNGDDFVADTPNAAGSNGGMPVFPHVTCNNGPNGDLFINYMDYTDDAGMFMFTNGQVNRMQACLDTDRSAIGYTKSGPTLALVDVHPTIAKIDHFPTLTWLDNPPTIAQYDHPPTLAWVDQQPTLARVDNLPTLAQADNPITISWLDNPPTIAQLDTPGTIAQLDNPGTIAQADVGGTLGAADIPQVGPIDTGDPGPVPFVLATPHHTMAWLASHRALAEQEIASLAGQAEQIEGVLIQFAQAEREGKLSATESASADQLYAEYQRLMAELKKYGALGNT